MRIYREKAGLISPGYCWVCYHDEYLYIEDSLPVLLWVLLTEWKHDRHLVGI